MGDDTPRAVSACAVDDGLEQRVSVGAEDDVESVEEVLWGAGAGDGRRLEFGVQMRMEESGRKAMRG